MAIVFDRTCWRGIQVDHPADWELAIASGTDEPGRCMFADRYFQRLDVRWRALTYVPDLEKMLEKHSRRMENTENVDIRPLTGDPPQWQGLVRNLPKGTIVHAGSFIREARWLIEVTIVWPDDRDSEVERKILSSIQAQDTSTKNRLWQAMGISMTIAADYKLKICDAKVGRVRWNFSGDSKHGPTLSVERIALPEYWLDKPLREWLEDELPSGYEPIRQESASFNNHRGEQLISSAKIGTLASFRGLRNIRLDIAWQCPIEERLYRVSFNEASHSREIEIPKHFGLRCCRRILQEAALGANA